MKKVPTLKIAAMAISIFTGQAVPLFPLHAAALTSIEFMRTFAGPQSRAMGGGIVSFDDSPSAMLNNPAELKMMYMPKLALFNASFPYEESYQFGGLTIPAEWGSVGGGVSYLSYGADAKYSSGGQEYSLSSSGETTVMLNASFPMRENVPLLMEHGSFGFNLKYVHSAFAQNSGDALVMDGGIIYHIPQIEGLKGSFVLRNIGLEPNFAGIDRSLVSRLTLGLGYEKREGKSLKITADAGWNAFSAGISFSPLYPVTVRCGWREIYQSPESGFRAGLGLDFNNFSLNYAAAPYQDASRNALTHQVGITISFWGFAQPKIAYEHYLKSHFEIARNEYEQRDYISARRELEDILSIYPNHQLSKEYLERIGQSLDEIEQQKNVEINKWLRRANVAMFQYDFLTARRYYNNILDVDPENMAALEGLKKIDEMVDEFQNEIQRESSRRQNRDKIIKKYTEAVELYQKGEYVLAKEKFQDLLTVDPENSEAEKYINSINSQLAKITSYQTNELYIKGMEYYEQGNYRDALKYFEAVSMAAPQRLDARDYIAECKKMIREEEEKLNSTKVARAHEKIREEVISLYDKAMRYYENGDYDNALKAFTKSKEAAMQYGYEKYIENSKSYLSNIRNALAVKHYKIGFEYAQKNKIESAAYEFRKALDYNPDYASARDELERISNTLSQQFYEQGMTFFASGDLTKAEELFKKSLFYRPEKYESQRALERIRQFRERSPR